MVHFVGAGCGAADLITVRGVRLLGQAGPHHAAWRGALTDRRLHHLCRQPCQPCTFGAR